MIYNLCKISSQNDSNRVNFNLNALGYILIYPEDFEAKYGQINNSYIYLKLTKGSDILE